MLSAGCVPIHIEERQLRQLGHEAISRQPKAELSWQELVNSLIARYPLVRTSIMDNPSTRLNIPKDDSDVGDHLSITLRKSSAITTLANLGPTLSNPQLPPRDKLDLIKSATREAEIAIAHFNILAAILSQAQSLPDRTKLRQMLAATMAVSPAIFKEGLKSDPHYSAITQSSRLVEYFQQSSAFADLTHQQALASMLQANQKTVVAPLLQAVIDGSYADAVKAIFDYPNILATT